MPWLTIAAGPFFSPHRPQPSEQAFEDERQDIRSSWADGSSQSTSGGVFPGNPEEAGAALLTWIVVITTGYNRVALI